MMGGICVMGGTYLSVGNTNNSCGEFNFLTDVEAADAVIKVSNLYIILGSFQIHVGIAF